YPAILLREGDSLIGVEIKDDSNPYLLMVTQQGMCLNAENDDIPLQGRKSQGVRGVQLSAGDNVIYATQNKSEGEIVCVSHSGWAKRVILAEIDPSKRYRKGVKLFDTDKAGRQAYVSTVTMPYDFAIVDEENNIHAVNTDALPICGRADKGKNVLKIIKCNAKKVVSARDNNI
ncbi:MAG: hypothetical protein K2I79_03325, partial [Clostridia bacterium]|nr:hypothetical protein [Clostridia bacterium]